MFTTIKTIAIASALALGTLAAVPASAQSSNFYFGMGGDRGGPGIEFRFGDGRHHRAPPRWEHRPGRHTCTAREALGKAERMGIRRAHLRGENRRTIIVGGRDRGRQVTVAFARAPGCPIVR